MITLKRNQTSKGKKQIKMDQGMDGLDALMASLSSSPKPVPAPSNKASNGGDATKDVSKQRQARASSLEKVATGRRDLDGELPERVVYFIDRLKRFQIRAADPSTREELNRRLSEKSQDYTFTMQYYYDRPELAEYTVNTEVARMEYTVYPGGGGGRALTSRAEIGELFEEHKARGGEDAAAAMLLWRVSNQSILSDTLQELSASFAQPADVELCIAISNTSSKFEIDFDKGKSKAESVFAISTVGVGEQAMTKMGSIVAVVEIDIKSQRLSLSVRELKLEMVFDDVLEAAARALAKGEEWSQQGNHESSENGPVGGGSKPALLQGLFSMGSSIIGSVAGGVVSATARARPDAPQLYRK